MPKRGLVLFAAAVGAAVAIPLLAVANHAYVSDPNDTRGLFDVKTARVNAARPPTWTVVTFPRWTVAQVWDAGYVMIRFDTFGTERFDYYALVRSNGYRMVGTLVRDRVNKSDFNVSHIKAWHPKPRKVRVRVPLEKMQIGKHRLHYRWRVETIYVTPNCPRSCLDHIPDRGAVSEMLPWVTPTATPTETPTVTPTETPSETPTETPAQSP